MASKLSDFTVKINLDGWYIAGYNTLGGGQLVNGKDIHPRMIQALKDKETFRTVAGDQPVCELLGGSIEDLERLFGADTLAPMASKPVESVLVNPPVPVPAAPAPTVQPPMAPPSVKPVRTPRPKLKDE